VTLLANEYPRGVVVTGHRWSATRNGSFFIRKHLGQLGGSNSIILCPFLLTESNISLGSSVLIRCNALTFWTKKNFYSTDRSILLWVCVKASYLTLCQSGRVTSDAVGQKYFSFLPGSHCID